jgi:hypothetical protein
MTVKVTPNGQAALTDLIKCEDLDIDNQNTDVTSNGALVTVSSNTTRQPTVSMAFPSFQRLHDKNDILIDNTLWQKVQSVEEVSAVDRYEALARSCHISQVIVISIHNWSAVEPAYIYGLDSTNGSLLYKLNLDKASHLGLAVASRRFAVSWEQTMEERYVKHFCVRTGKQLGKSKLRRHHSSVKETQKEDSSSESSKSWHCIRGKQVQMTETDIMLPFNVQAHPDAFDLIQY